MQGIEMKKTQEIKCKKCIVSKWLKEVAEPLTNWLFVWLADAEVEQEINSICRRLTLHYYFLVFFFFFFSYIHKPKSKVFLGKLVVEAYETPIKKI